MGGEGDAEGETARLIPQQFSFNRYSAFSPKQRFSCEVSFHSSVTGAERERVVGLQKSHPRMDEISLRRGLCGCEELFIYSCHLSFLKTPPNALRHGDWLWFLQRAKRTHIKHCSKKNCVWYTPQSLPSLCTVPDCISAVCECMDVCECVGVCVHYSIPIRLKKKSFTCTNYTWGPLDGIKISFLLTCIKFFFFFKDV